MSWIAITIDTLYEAKVAALIDACDTAAKASGQDDRAAGLIQGVVNEVRNAVATCSRNQVDSDTTKIPASQRDLAVDLIMARLKGVIDEALTEDERSNVAERRKQLRDIAACNLVVDQPDNPVAPEVQQSGAATVISKNCRPLSSGGMNGL